MTACVRNFRVREGWGNCHSAPSTRKHTRGHSPFNGRRQQRAASVSAVLPPHRGRAEACSVIKKPPSAKPAQRPTTPSTLDVTASALSCVCTRTTLCRGVVYYYTYTLSPRRRSKRPQQRRNSRNKDKKSAAAAACDSRARSTAASHWGHAGSMA